MKSREKTWDTPAIAAVVFHRLLLRFRTSGPRRPQVLVLETEAALPNTRLGSLQGYVRVELPLKIEGNDTSAVLELSYGESADRSFCMDAGDFNSPPNEHHKALLARMAAFEPSRSLLCIPSRMQTYASLDVARAWPSHLTVVVANGNDSQPSVIRPHAACSDPTPASYGGASNSLLIRSIA